MDGFIAGVLSVDISGKQGKWHKFCAFARLLGVSPSPILR